MAVVEKRINTIALACLQFSKIQQLGNNCDDKEKDKILVRGFFINTKYLRF